MAKTKSAKRKKGLPFSIIAVILCSCIVIGFIIAIVKEQSEINNKQDALDRNNTELSQLNAENDALAVSVEDGDTEELLEQYAYEDGYIYPDEHVYIET